MNDILQEQQRYYAARAAEYDQWFLRQGRYDHGPQENQRWFDAVAALRSRLDSFAPQGDVLEIACGSGNWTTELARHAGQLLAIDGSAEMLAICRTKVAAANVSLQQADIFSWQPPRRFDVVFFGFWLSHVPDSRFDAFWQTVDRALKQDGRVFFADSLPHPASSAVDHLPADPQQNRQQRRLNDGRVFEVVKRYWRPAALTHKLASLGWQAEIQETGGYFSCGTVVRSTQRDTKQHSIAESK